MSIEKILEKDIKYIGETNDAFYIGLGDNEMYSIDKKSKDVGYLMFTMYLDEKILDNIIAESGDIVDGKHEDLSILKERVQSLS